MSKYTGTILVTFGAKIQIFEKLVMQTANDTFFGGFQTLCNRSEVPYRIFK